MQAYILIQPLIFVLAFPSRGVAGAAALCGPEIPDDQQNFRYFCWLPHLRGTKQGRRCSHATWSLDELWAAFPWV